MEITRWQFEDSNLKLEEDDSIWKFKDGDSNMMIQRQKFEDSDSKMEIKRCRFKSRWQFT